MMILSARLASRSTTAAGNVPSRRAPTWRLQCLGIRTAVLCADPGRLKWRASDNVSTYTTCATAPHSQFGTFYEVLVGRQVSFCIRGRQWNRLTEPGNHSWRSEGVRTGESGRVMHLCGRGVAMKSFALLALLVALAKPVPLLGQHRKV